MKPEWRHGGLTTKKRFGVFEFDLQARELTKHGVRVKVQEQPTEILAALLEQAGQIVPREDLQRRLWPDGTFVDYEQSLNKAVNKLREALGDSADHPIYIETLARRGYRFVAPVEGDPAETPAARTTAPRRRMLPWLAAGGVVLAMVLATGLWPIDVPQVERVVPLTNDTSFKIAFGRLVADGNRVLYGDGADVWSVPASGGEPRKLSLPFLHGVKILADYSPIRQQLLLASAYTGKSGANELWLAGTEGEAPHKIGEVQSPSQGRPLSGRGTDGRLHARWHLYPVDCEWHENENPRHEGDESGPAVVASVGRQSGLPGFSGRPAEGSGVAGE